MKKLLLLTLLLCSSFAQAEWIVLSCVDKDSSVVVEFDEAAQLVRYQNSNIRVFKATISEYKISWTDTQYNSPFYLDRLSGKMQSYMGNMTLMGSWECSSRKKKF